MWKHLPANEGWKIRFNDCLAETVVYLPPLPFVIATHLALACSAISLPAFTAAKSFFLSASFFLIATSVFLPAAESVPSAAALTVPFLMAMIFAVASPLASIGINRPEWNQHGKGQQNYDTQTIHL